MSIQTLTTAPVGQTLRLAKMPTDSKWAPRLAALGITPGVELTVLQASGGALVLAVRGYRVALGHSLAQNLYVENE